MSDIDVLFEKGGRCFNAEDYEAAVALYKKCYKHYKKRGLELSQDALYVLECICASYERMHYTEKALKYGKSLYERCLEVYGPYDELTLDTLDRLVVLYLEVFEDGYDSSALKKAISLSKESYAIHKHVLGKKHPATLISLYNRGLVFKARLNYDKALEKFEKCYMRQSNVLGSDDLYALKSLESIGDMHVLLNNPASAIGCYEEVYNTRTALLENNDDNIVVASKLAYALSKAGRFDEAIAIYMKCYDLLVAEYGKEHLASVETLKNLASVYSAKGDHRKAIELMEESVGLDVEAIEEGDVSDLLFLADEYRKDGDEENAQKIEAVCESISVEFSDEVEGV